MRVTALIVALNLTLDLSAPLVPGAFDFDPDDSVEALVSGVNATGMVNSNGMARN